MSTQNLLERWSIRDNNRLTAKQTSIRLPTHVAARISALCEIYSNKTKSELIGDLLASSLDELEKGMNYDEGDEPIQKLPDGELIYPVYGPGLKGQYLNIANKYLKELEGELGNDEPELFYVIPESEFDRR